MGGRQRPRAHTGEQDAEKAIFEATERLLAEQPLHELSVAQIITAAGLSRATFYHYFSSKFENQHAVPALAQVWSAASAPFVAVLSDQIGREREAGRSIAGLPAEAIATMLVSGAERIFYVGSTGSDPRLATADQRLDAIVTIALAAIYGSPTGPREPGRRSRARRARPGHGN
jgi:AcrR family transcriptional regulator